MKNGNAQSIILRITAFIGCLAVVAQLSNLFARFLTRGLNRSRPDPVSNYEAALARFALLQAQDDERVNPLCRSQLLSHGRKSERVIILVHGITNCPQQFVELAPLFYKLGYNVLIPRMPHNGLADRMTDDLKHLTARELCTFGDTLVDIACGLGEHVTFAGLSAGGVIAAWVAQQRAEVDLAVLIAPSLAVGNLGIRMSRLAMNLAFVLPDILTQRFAPFEAAPEHSYLGYSTRALGEVMRMGAAIYRAALKKKPAVQSIVLITNANDTAVDALVIWQLMSTWQVKGLQHLVAYTFDKELRLGHDLIDPQQQDQQVATVYPILLNLIAGEQATPALKESLSAKILDASEERA